MSEWTDAQTKYVGGLGTKITLWSFAYLAAHRYYDKIYTWVSTPAVTFGALAAAAVFVITLRENNPLWVKVCTTIISISAEILVSIFTKYRPDMKAQNFQKAHFEAEQIRDVIDSQLANTNGNRPDYDLFAKQIRNQIRGMHEMAPDSIPRGIIDKVFTQIDRVIDTHESCMDYEERREDRVSGPENRVDGDDASRPSVEVFDDDSKADDEHKRRDETILQINRSIMQRHDALKKFQLQRLARLIGD